MSDDFDLRSCSVYGMMEMEMMEMVEMDGAGMVLRRAGSYWRCEGSQSSQVFKFIGQQMLVDITSCVPPPHSHWLIRRCATTKLIRVRKHVGEVGDGRINRRIT